MTTRRVGRGSVVAAIPGELLGRLAPAELFHEVLEHRWFLSEAAGHDVGTTLAARSYFETVLPEAPEEVTASLAVGRPWQEVRAAFPCLRAPRGTARPGAGWPSR